MKARIETGEVPLFFGGPHRFGDFGHHGLPFGPHEHLSATADYLGLSVPQLMQKLASGQSLADIAKAQNKSVNGSEEGDPRQRDEGADQAVKNGVLTQAQAKEGLKMLESRLDEIVNGSLPRMPECGGSTCLRVRRTEAAGVCREPRFIVS